MDECHLCKCNRATQSHHVILRKECKPLEFCDMNQVRLCNECHDYLHHDRNGYKLIKKLKLEFQNKLEFLLDKQQLTKEEVNEVLQISEKALNSLFKTIQSKGNKYTREDCIRTIMGGKVQLE